MPHPKIAIIGAGPVGTTLARLLLLQSPSISVTIFEGEQSPDYRSQGGTLDLHTATGLAALKEAGLWDEFLKHARYDGEALLITDKNLKPYVQVRPSSSPDDKKGGYSNIGGQRPEIDRAALRKMLVESVPPETIRWGHRLREVHVHVHPGPGPDPDPQPTGRRHELVFALPDGTTTALSGFDLVVGADGAWSRVRRALTDVAPRFAGVAYQAFEVPDAAAAAPEVSRLVGGGSVFSHADGVKTSVQQMGDGSLLVSVCFRTTRTDTTTNTTDADTDTDTDTGDGDGDDWIRKCGYDAYDLEQARAATLARLEGWHPLIREAVSSARGRTTPRSLYMLPVGVRFGHRAGVTVIGDAAHLMTPFAGEGVNVGMEDARRLAGAVVAAVAAGGEDVSLGALDGAVAAFEEDMFVRAGEFAGLTEALLRYWFFTEDCPRSVFPSAMATHVGFHAPRLLRPLVGGLVYGYFTLRNLIM